MKRDMDLVRTLLLAIDENPEMDGTRWGPADPEQLGVSDRSDDEVAYHMTLLVESGLVKGDTAMQMPIISGLTWNGHEFLDDIRDPGIWAKTKERLGGLSSVGISIVAEIAKSEIKKRLHLP